MIPRVTILRNLGRQAHRRVPTIRPKLQESRIDPLLVGVGAAGLAAIAYIGTSRDGKSLTTSLSSSSSLPIPEVVPALNLEQATAKLAQEEKQGNFSEGLGGTFFSVRLASNSPVEDNLSHGTAPGAGKTPWRFWGVYDGHAGWATSSVLADSLIPYVSAHLSKTPADAPTPELITSIKRAFTALDDQIFTNARNALKNQNTTLADGISAIAPAIAGSCAVLSAYNPHTSQLLTACTGDSRVVLGRLSSDKTTHTCEPLSVDQNGKNPLEHARLTALHPNEPEMLNPQNGRLLGFALSRAFGDSRGKWSNEEQSATFDRFWGYKALTKVNLTPPYFTAEPEVTETEVREGDFVILASDGLWDHISSENAVECVSQWLSAVRSGRIDPSTPTPLGVLNSPSVSKPNKDDSFGREPEDARFITWQATPEFFVTEDHNAATHLVKNAFGGSRRGLFTGVVGTYSPISRYVRDDVTVQVVVFGGVRR